MKSLTIRLPDDLVAELEAASSAAGTTVSSVVRDRVSAYKVNRSSTADTLALIGDLAGSVGGLPVDLSSRTKHYLKKTGYGRRDR